MTVFRIVFVIFVFLSIISNNLFAQVVLQQNNIKVEGGISGAGGFILQNGTTGGGDYADADAVGFPSSSDPIFFASGGYSGSNTIIPFTNTASALRASLGGEAILTRARFGGNTGAVVTIQYRLRFSVPFRTDMFVSGTIGAEADVDSGLTSDHELSFRIRELPDPNDPFAVHRGSFSVPGIPPFGDFFVFDPDNIPQRIRLSQGVYEIWADGVARVTDARQTSPNLEQLGGTARIGMDLNLSWTTNSFCTADFNRDGLVDFFDYLDFMAAFDSPDETTFDDTWHEQMEADINGDKQVDGFDLLDFLQAYNAGC